MFRLLPQNFWFELTVLVGALEFEFSRCMVHLQLLAASDSRVHIRVVVHPVVHACNMISCMHDLNSEI